MDRVRGFRGYLTGMSTCLGQSTKAAAAEELRASAQHQLAVRSPGILSLASAEIANRENHL